MARTLRYYYNEDPIWNHWTLFDSWAEMHYCVGGANPNYGTVYSIRISNDADPTTAPHSHIFVSFRGAVKAGGLMTPKGIHYRLKAGEEKVWDFPTGIALECPEPPYVWLKCNDAAEVIPVPKRLSIHGNGATSL